LSEGQTAPRGRGRPGANDAGRAKAKGQPGRSPRKKDRKPGKAKSGNANAGKAKSGKAKSGKSKKGKSWKP
jgi:ribonuclease R